MPPPLHGDPLLPAPAATLSGALERVRGTGEDWLHVHSGAQVEALTGRALADEALRWAGALQRAGVLPGDRVALLLPNSVAFVAAFFGCQYAGAVAVPLSWPVSLLDLQRVLSTLAPLVENADPRVVISTPAVAELSPFGLRCLSEPGPTPASSLPAVSPDDPAFIQYTSGSLGRPRGAVITQGAAVASAWSMGQALGLDHRDRGVSWLPLFHDMGLVGGLLCPLLRGFPIHLMTPAEFLLHPVRWLRLLSQVGGTIATAPDFAYGLAARRVRDVAGLDLSRWRCALNGSEPVHRSTMDAFVERFAPVGFSASAFRPVYGLAENTLGVAFAGPGDPDVRRADRTLVSVGRPLPGMEVAVSPSGEVLVRGPSRMSGYYQAPEATRLALRDGWLHTGDLGFIQDGRLYLVGREKDLVIQNGRKFHPYDIERIAALSVDSLPNAAAAFADPREELVVVVEVAAGVDDVERRVRGELLATLGVRPHRVISVGPGDLPRTTSGKLRRPACIERYS